MKALPNTRTLAFTAMTLSFAAAITGCSSSAPFNGSTGHNSWINSSGNIYIADTQNNRIRQVDTFLGIITTVAGNGTPGSSGDGGAATSAELDFPMSVVVDSAGNLFIADNSNNKIRRVDGTSGVITTVAGNGTGGSSGDSGAATSAELNGPTSIAVDDAGNLFIADSVNNKIRRVDGTSGVITTVAGNGTGGSSGDSGAATSAELSGPTGIAVDGAGNLFIADNGNNKIRRVDGTSGVITTVAGNGTAGSSGDSGAATSAELKNVGGVTIDSSGNLLIATADSVRKVSNGIITTVAGDGVHQNYNGDGGLATASEVNAPGAVTLDFSGNTLIGDTGNNRIRRVDASSGIITTIAGNGTYAYSGDDGPATSAEVCFPFDTVY